MKVFTTEKRWEKMIKMIFFVFFAFVLPLSTIFYVGCGTSTEDHTTAEVICYSGGEVIYQEVFTNKYIYIDYGLLTVKDEETLKINMVTTGDCIVKFIEQVEKP